MTNPIRHFDLSLAESLVESGDRDERRAEHREVARPEHTAGQIFRRMVARR